MVDNRTSTSTGRKGYRVKAPATGRQRGLSLFAAAPSERASSSQYRTPDTNIDAARTIEGASEFPPRPDERAKSVAYDQRGRIVTDAGVPLVRPRAKGCCVVQ